MTNPTKSRSCQFPTLFYSPLKKKRGGGRQPFRTHIRYPTLNYRLVEGNTASTNFDKGDYHVAGSSATSESTNQVEFTVKKHSEYGNGVWANYNVRSEYGNGNSYAYSSSGSEKNNTDSQFEVKEAFVEIGALPYFGNDSVVWPGQRYLNRSSGILSLEYWKQSSGVGAGFETKLAGHKVGIAYGKGMATNRGVNFGEWKITSKKMTSLCLSHLTECGMSQTTSS